MPEDQKMPDYMVLLSVARDEIITILQYSEMLEKSPDKSTIQPTLDEIRGDEFNHALISMLMAAKIMGIKIATDDITPDPNNIEIS